MLNLFKYFTFEQNIPLQTPNSIVKTFWFNWIWRHLLINHRTRPSRKINWDLICNFHSIFHDMNSSNFKINQHNQNNQPLSRATSYHHFQPNNPPNQPTQPTYHDQLSTRPPMSPGGAAMRDAPPRWIQVISITIKDEIIIQNKIKIYHHLFFLKIIFTNRDIVVDIFKIKEEDQNVELSRIVAAIIHCHYCQKSNIHCHDCHNCNHHQQKRT